MEKYKQNLLNDLKSHVDFIREKIREKLESVKIVANKSLDEIRKMPPSDQAVNMMLRANAESRLSELGQLEGSPYFIKCEIINEAGEEKKYFFAKHEFSEQSIYSWVAPIATIRFESPGQVSYKLPTGKVKTIKIKEKEQYMIVDGKVIFFARETESKPRELIYQEHFTKQKSEFALPEIVAQMEKAQDQVIRAGYQGPMVISGPAGSGKTTLALHRVAYLTQAPDTTELYPPRSIIVFVQDAGTKDYFSTLLPGLGIRDVHITTFSEWAFSILNIDDCTYVERYGDSDEEKDLYEYQKLRTLRENIIFPWNRNYYTTLRASYEKYLLPYNSRSFERQKKEKRLDRFDIVILLKSYFEKYEKFELSRGYQVSVNGKIIQKVEKRSILYSLMIVDEFQNYLSEQLDIFRSCLNKKTESVVYVGDIAQQVKLGTVKNWEDIGEVISVERKVRLNKVYRNTKNILTYIEKLGFKIEIPNGLKLGPPVTEKVANTIKEEIKHVREFIPKYSGGSIGILAKNFSYLEHFKKEFSNEKNIHILTMIEAQGVEFDIVFLVGVNKEYFTVTHHIDVSPEHIEERKRMQKDLLYVALTRAITELHVLGPDKLENIFRTLP